MKNFKVTQREALLSDLSYDLTGEKDQRMNIRVPRSMVKALEVIYSDRTANSSYKPKFSASAEIVRLIHDAITEKQVKEGFLPF